MTYMNQFFNGGTNESSLKCLMAYLSFFPIKNINQVTVFSLDEMNCYCIIYFTKRKNYRRNLNVIIYYHFNYFQINL